MRGGVCVVSEGLEGKQELQEVLKFPIEIIWNLEASLKSETISMFFVEIHLDVVLEVLLMVGLDFFLSKLVDRYHRKIH